MKNALKVFALFIAVASVLSLSGCGKMSDPVPVEESGYPHQYPRR